MSRKLLGGHSFKKGLNQNIEDTEPFRQGKSAVGRFIDVAVVTLVFIFKFAVVKVKETFRDHSELPYFIFTGIWAVVIVGSIYFFTSYSFGVKVSLGELEVVVNDRMQFSDALNKVENDYTIKTGESFYFDNTPVYSLTLVKNNFFSSSEDVYNSLSNEAEISMGMSYGVFVDGELIGTYPKETDLWELFEKIKALYSDPTAVNEEITIQNDIQFVKGMYAKNKSRTIDELYDIFTVPADNRTVTVVKNTKIANVAKEYGLTVAQLKILNPDYNFDSPKTGSKLYVSKPECSLDIASTRTVVYTKEIAYKTITTYDKSMFETQSVVTKNGSNGITEYTDEVTLVNGDEVTRKNLGQVVLKAVVNRAITKGTKSLAPTGKFIWPLAKGSYRITSYYMDKAYYKQFGSWHKGLDLGAKGGTPIYAADSGTVIYAGWTSGSGYGYLVKVEHQSGVVTYYGHCKSIAVKKGQKVYQGQVIAYVGTTGNSTGNHLHFEIKVNGQNVNPELYLKGYA